MSVFEIYIAPRSLIAFGAELVWLVLSALALCVIANTSIHGHIAPMSLADQVSVIIAIYLSVFYLMDLYQENFLEPGRDLLLNLTQAGCIVAFVIGAVEVSTKVLPFHPFLTVAHLLLTAAFVICARAAIQHTCGGANAGACVGIIASDPMRQLLLREYSHTANGLRLDWLGTSLGEAQEALQSNSRPGVRIRHLAIERAILEDSNAASFLQRWRADGVCFENLKTFAERTCGKIMVDAEMASDIAGSRNLGPSRIEKLVRRARDLIVAFLGLLITSPLSLFVVLAIKLESPGPALFRQERIGENGRRFVMLKFRSMFVDIKTTSSREWTTRQNDPRVTYVGRVLRLLHIDEIPQLINVIRGEMSMVGPRPFHPDQVAELESSLPSYGLRHLVRPGITGWAQVTCNYDASTNQKSEVFARDLYYVKHAGLLFDLLIMISTIRVCLWRHGAR
jgi:exopolysaccharide biosynthesis polyprenyl glycosylphosphotransferase